MKLSILLNKIYIILIAYSLKIIGAIVVLIIGHLIIKLLVIIINNTLKKFKTDELIRTFLKSFIKVTLYIVLVITIASILGIQMTAFITLLGAAGLAIGLALQGSLSNFAGGILILLFRLFKVGDMIEAQGYKGKVDSIQILYTIINTPDNKKVIIPNGILSNNSVVNITGNINRRVDLRFGVSYGDDVVKVKEVLKKIIDEYELILKEPKPVVGVIEHADSSINFEIKVWVKREDFWNVTYGLNEKVKLEFDKQDITIPFPQRDIYLYQK